MNPYQPPKPTDTPNRIGAFVSWIADPLFADPITAVGTVMLATGAIMVGVFWLLVQLGIVTR
jgi:hypothetical protein